MFSCHEAYGWLSFLQIGYLHYSSSKSTGRRLRCRFMRGSSIGLKALNLLMREISWIDLLN